MTARTTLKLLMSLCFSLVLLVGAGYGQRIKAQGKSNKPVKKLIHLQASALAPNATGIAKIMAKSKGKSKQDFMVVGANLTAGSTYLLFVDGIQIDSKVAEPEQGENDDTGGAAAVVFHYSSKVHAGDDDDEGIQPLPDSLNPVTDIKLVEIKDASGGTLLSGMFPAS